MSVVEGFFGNPDLVNYLVETLVKEELQSRNAYKACLMLSLVNKTFNAVIEDFLGRKSTPSIFTKLHNSKENPWVFTRSGKHPTAAFKVLPKTLEIQRVLTFDPCKRPSGSCYCYNSHSRIPLLVEESFNTFYIHGGMRVKICDSLMRELTGGKSSHNNEFEHRAVLGEGNRFMHIVGFVHENTNRLFAFTVDLKSPDKTLTLSSKDQFLFFGELQQFSGNFTKSSPVLDVVFYRGMLHIYCFCGCLQLDNRNVNIFTGSFAYLEIDTFQDNAAQRVSYFCDTALTDYLTFQKAVFDSCYLDEIIPHIFPSDYYCEMLVKHTCAIVIAFSKDKGPRLLNLTSSVRDSRWPETTLKKIKSQYKLRIDHSTQSVEYIQNEQNNNKKTR